ncbi:dihydroxyacetone kinase subunit DhaK [Rhizomonospora bruguierae]|uniref:dihydroxyacetone kinase subunit DhaK n=1 Tax=Rhizomonospora bruguierae TaxID=1581705 RepID=UPI001BCDA592|nr:dihydroxyacetone kinase subunit DhaK [Micromonospora sp. NBRC 107566]
MKRFMNEPADFVRDMLEGVALANPDTLEYVPEFNLIRRKAGPSDGRVSLIQGSGSGHEPAHAMLVGPGMLDGACPGDVFAAPPLEYVLGATRSLRTPAGVVYIVNNYTGDRMVFEMASEVVRAEGIDVRTVLVDDDVAVKDSTYTVGRRGIAGNFFVIKAMGAAAAAGAPIDEVVRIGEAVNAATRSMGMALTSCSPPAKGAPLFALGESEVELGVGIHGEPGRQRTTLSSADQTVEVLLGAILAEHDVNRGDEVAVMVNGLGATPINELYILYGSAHKQLRERGIQVRRNYVGDYCTSLDMAGVSITVVKLTDEIERLLSEPAQIPIRVF